MSAQNVLQNCHSPWVRNKKTHCRRLTLEGYLTSLARLCQSEPVCEGGDQEARESLERREDGEGWGADVPRMLQQERGCRGPQQVRRYAHTT